MIPKKIHYFINPKVFCGISEQFFMSRHYRVCWWESWVKVHTISVSIKER